jgi:cell wall-associated NlpC family hydrolase
MRVEKHLPKISASMCKIAAQYAPREACGYLNRSGDIGELPNRSITPDETFDMGALADVTAVEGEIAAIWHTHPEDQPPSPADIEGCRATWLPWIIASPNHVWVIYPEKLPYVGRDFVYGITDCWQLIADWYAQERARPLPWFTRPPDGWWETSGPSPYLQNAAEYGFTLHEARWELLQSLAPGDIILMRIRGRRTNHAAVYLGGGNILHHLHGFLSTVVQLDAQWQRFVTHIARPTC